ncbi:polygalacturonase [Xanthomonas translucens pv. arrhenatheri]|uniref:Polygalacturonase n=1 Tax=Xanthomonas graminis pv. arrhenatheri LMG 727 TaxID=1195923 RepID=A0A0K2ZFB3_9XANT|nr:glycoside hydrolase family 28 protein [Xanthomonas translucens]OAX65177.1 polygalacturonase [Xanthomonas translucens pv. arrhenatheri]UKE76190.1 glycoside hydrolase family 28 protein [Xanthomonas translucens pv. arrhenatheri]CTP84293.1 Polygalacturonase [Xanthomonas translucens pv. arrhenatheri LMG 727]
MTTASAMSRLNLALPLLAIASLHANAAVHPPLAQRDQAANVSTGWGTIDQPTLPQNVCMTLAATLQPIGGSLDGVDADPAYSAPDTLRIQDAISDCPAGSAVQLVTGAHGESGFLSGPLTLKSGVTLWIDQGVTLFGSRNPRDYDNGLGTCGIANTDKGKSCKPLIYGNAISNSGVVGDGKIDGRGGSVLTAGPNAGKRSWWDVAYQNVSQGLVQHAPRLLQIDNSKDFTLYALTLENSPNFHVVTDNVSGVTVWGIKILSPSLVYTRPGYACPAGSTPDQRTPATCFTPETAKNTDGFDPGQSRNVLLAYSYISTGDDNVAIKAHASAKSSNPSTDMAFVNNQFYYGHGMSFGSETDTGIHRVQAQNLSIDGFNSNDAIKDPAANNGLRIKSDRTRGGQVSDITFENICMRNVARPLVFDAFYSKPANADLGSAYPRFDNITLRNVHSLGSRDFGAGQLSFYGYRDAKQSYPITLALDNVVLEGGAISFAAPHNGGPNANPAATHFRFTGGPVSFANLLVSSTQYDVQLQGQPGTGKPLDCSAAFVTYSSVLADSPI